MPYSGDYGFEAMWGSSPALNLINYLPDGLETWTKSGKRSLDILLVGQSDMRHVLKTLTSNWELLQNSNLQFHFYIVNDSMEAIAREALLFLLASQPTENLGLTEKCYQFLELFGNGLIRPKTEKTLVALTKNLIEILTSKEESKLYEFSCLKFRERDDILDIFKCWLTPNEFPFSEEWNRQVEKDLHTQYNSRRNVFDWDYHAYLQSRYPTIIELNEYVNWRDTGLAFVDSDSAYSQINPTLLKRYSSPKAKRQAQLGRTGPFASFGIESSQTPFFHKINGKYEFTSKDVSMANLKEMFSIMTSPGKPLSKVLQLTYLSLSCFIHSGPIFESNLRDLDLIYLSNLSAIRYLELPFISLIREGVPFVIENFIGLVEIHDIQIQKLREAVEKSAAEHRLERQRRFTPFYFLRFLKMSDESNVKH